MEDYGPYSITFVEEQPYRASKVKSHSNNEGSKEVKGLFDDSCKKRTYKGSTANVATKCTQTLMERRMCYRCALVIQDVKVPQTVIDSDPIFETNKKDRTLPPTEIQIDQLETLAQDGMPNKSQSLSSFSISR